MNLRGEIIGLSVGYALLGLLLLLVLIRVRLPWMAKAAAIVVTSAFYVIVFYRIEGVLGWSAPVPLPPRFQLLWSRVVEPNLALQEAGAIHLWAEALDDANLPSGVPRAYQLPYSHALARKAETARVEIMAGRPQGGRAEQFGSGAETVQEGSVRAVPGTEPGGDPSGGGLLDPAFMGGDSQAVEFAPLPVAKLPAKDAP
jgi:hypothetical protein